MSEKKLLSDFDAPFKVQQNRKPVYINKHLAQDLKEFAKANDKCPIKIAEYLICLGLYSVDRNIEGPISFDIKSL